MSSAAEQLLADIQQRRAALIDQHAGVEQAVVKAARADLQVFWRTLPLDQPELARDALMDYMTHLVDQYGKAAGSAAADFYDELRSDAAVRRDFRALVAQSDTEAVRGATRRLAGAFFDGNPADALIGSLAVVDKLVKQVSRNTIIGSRFKDPYGTPGWERVIRGDTCPFCRMLASRGAVYRADTATFAAHHDCDCVAAPSWDNNAPEVEVRQYVASRRTSTMKPAQRERHRANIRRYLADFTG